MTRLVKTNYLSISPFSLVAAATSTIARDIHYRVFTHTRYPYGGAHTSNDDRRETRTRCLVVSGHRQRQQGTPGAISEYQIRKIVSPVLLKAADVLTEQAAAVQDSIGQMDLHADAEKLR